MICDQHIEICNVWNENLNLYKNVMKKESCNETYQIETDNGIK